MRSLNKPMVEKQYRVVIRQLLMHKADPTQKNAKGLTAMEVDAKWREFLLAEIENTKVDDRIRERAVLRLNDEGDILAAFKEADTFLEKNYHPKKQ